MDNSNSINIQDRIERRHGKARLEMSSDDQAGAGGGVRERTIRLM